MHGHVYTQTLTGYTGVHLIFGSWVLMYIPYKGSILYLDLVDHSILENKALSSILKIKLDKIENLMKVKADKVFEK
jgi:hypothetical protein